MEWINLKVLNNCFRDKERKHLGFKYEGNWYAITHNEKGGIIKDSDVVDIEESN